MLPESGPLAWTDVARELVWPTNTPLPMNAPEVYALTGKAPGSFIRFPDDFYGKAFLDIIPDRMTWDDLEGIGQSMGINRTFTGLALGVEIEIVVHVDAEIGHLCVIDVYRDNEVVGSFDIQENVQTPVMRVKVSNATKVRFAARSVSGGPLEAIVRVLNGAFYDQEIDRFNVKLV